MILIRDGRIRLNRGMHCLAGVIMSIDYKKAGVDVEKGDQLVDWLQTNTPSRGPHHDKIVSGIGGFASLFKADFSHLKKPLLITCTDGVGTKVKLASHFENYSGVGQDLVAMCVNDLICCGGEPLMFLDYYATSKLDLKAAQEFLKSVQSACLESDCALVGGETAEMPGVYHDRDFDCAGFAVGVVDQEALLGPHLVKEGDLLLGVESSGFHSNGYSLVRQLFEKDLSKWEKELLAPTRLYVRMMKAIRNQIHAAAHITGGGIENIPRVLPAHTKAVLKPWIFSPLFQEAQKRAGLSTVEMLKTFNCGYGFVVVVAPDNLIEVQKQIEEKFFKTAVLGSVQKSNQKEPSVEVQEVRNG